MQGGMPQGGFQQPPPETTVWVFEAEPGQWAPFAPEDSMLIENEHAKGQPQVTVNLRNIQYLLNFQTMSRKNVQSGSERKMQRTTLGNLPKLNMLQPTGPPPPQGPCWLFMDEKGQYMGLSPEDSESIEKVYKAGQPTGKINLRGVDYELSFAEWTRTNLGSGSKRAIRRVDPKSLPPYQPAEKGVMWCLQDDQGCWIPCAPEDAKLVEDAFAKGNSSAVVGLMGGQAQYEVNFQAWTIKNAQSGASRVLRRLNDGKPEPAV